MAQHDASRHYDTIIIGAGMSGLACASRLSDHATYQEGKRLLVLEARDRIGGRIESVHVNGTRLDTGANWIHGIGTKDKPNPLVQILPDKRMKELACGVYFKAADSNADKDQPGKDLVIPSEIAETLMGSLWGLIGSLHETALSHGEDAKHLTILETIQKDENFKAVYEAVPEEYRDTLSILPQFVEGMEAGPLDRTTAEHPEDEPGLALSEYSIEDFDGSQVFLGDGYVAVVNEVAKRVFERDQVKLGVEVKRISWSTNPIEIETSDGTFTAGEVVSTIPLGVLKKYVRPSGSGAEQKSLFVPQLPAPKVEAITSLGYGTLDKIFLVYSSPWWKTEPYFSILKKGFTSMGPDESDEEDFSPNGHSTAEPEEPDTFISFTTELPGLSISPSHVKPGPSSLFMTNLHSLTGFPALSAFVSCSSATHIESLSDQEASMIVHRALTKGLGREPPLPDAVHVTRWAADQYSLGSYTHMIKGVSETQHRAEFQEPVVNERGATLRFAGEHTSVNHFATVHGALLSGWREADAVLKGK
ncbi:flavin containing amine oxidoreductase protein [Rutstroemia sp. NJR-2017a WRK4]|nr:flavin containing amine oxidoreductase protein [Rutstroemia sp. NJR-2017a WRK4]